MLCPHCSLAINFEYEYYNIWPTPDFDESKIGLGVTIGICPACENLIVLFEQGYATKGEYGYSMNGVEEAKIIFPHATLRLVEPEVPPPYKEEFIEANEVLNLSPKASAALSRRILQNVMRDVFNVKHSDLAKEIDEFIATKGAPSYVNQAIDAVRNVGNFAAHPLKSKSTGQIVEVEPGEAEWLLEALEALFDFAFVQPKRLEAKRNKLNEKLKDLGKPPMK
jgi:hypothetical protein